MSNPSKILDSVGHNVSDGLTDASQVGTTLFNAAYDVGKTYLTGASHVGKTYLAGAGEVDRDLLQTQGIAIKDLVHGNITGAATDVAHGVVATSKAYLTDAQRDGSAYLQGVQNLGTSVGKLFGDVEDLI